MHPYATSRNLAYPFMENVMKSIEKQLRDLREALMNVDIKVRGHDELVRYIKNHPDRYPISDIAGEEGFRLRVALESSDGLSDDVERAVRILSGEEPR